MTERLPRVSALAVPGLGQAQLEQIVTEITVDYQTDAVAELAITLADVDHEVTEASGKLIGASVTLDGVRWQIGAVDADLAEWGTQLVLRCRDPLAKQLRKTYKTSAEKKVSPGAWVTSRVKAAGGRAIVQPSSKRGTIAQSKNDSVMDVIGALAGDLEWSWTAYEGVLLFGSRHAAWKAPMAGRSTWPVTWAQDKPSDALTASWTDSDDSTDNKAQLDVELAYVSGKQIRPWDRLQSTIPGASGLWLVESVGITHDGVSPVTITAVQPNRPSPKAGSSSKE